MSNRERKMFGHNFACTAFEGEPWTFWRRVEKKWGVDKFYSSSRAESEGEKWTHEVKLVYNFKRIHEGGDHGNSLWPPVHFRMQHRIRFDPIAYWPTRDKVVNALNSCGGKLYPISGEQYANIAIRGVNSPSGIHSSAIAAIRFAQVVEKATVL